MKKKNYKLIFCLALLVQLALACNAYAWYDYGHMVVAQIAYDNLTDSTKTKVNDLLKVLADADPDYSDFVRAATWMDGVKSTGLQFFNDYHFIDQPIVIGDVPSVPAEQFNVVWAIGQAKASLTDPKASVFAEALALRFLIHTVGDVHQPLHAVSLFSAQFPEGDRGGNEFKLKQDNRKDPANLHALWDSAVLALPDTRVSQITDLTQVVESAHKLVSTITIDKDKVADANPADWARESMEVAKSAVYAGINPQEKPSAEYIARGQVLAEQRIVMAGLRLADMLNAIFANRK